MKFRIGFDSEIIDKEERTALHTPQTRTVIPRKSVVQVMFPRRWSTLAYYNDRFDLRVGDYVYVDGKLEGLRGRVTEVNYNFKIKLSDYKRVIAVVDTDVSGRFYLADDYFVSFDRCAIPASKLSLWFNPPVSEEEEFITGCDGSSFYLDDLKGMKVSPEVPGRGYDYYMDNKVIYLSIDGAKGHAIVQGTKAYDVEFEYRDGLISNLTCSCYCTNHCKHEYAVMLQLKDILHKINTCYADEHAGTDYFAAIFKGTFFTFAVDGKETGSFTLN